MGILKFLSILKGGVDPVASDENFFIDKGH